MFARTMLMAAVALVAMGSLFCVGCAGTGKSDGGSLGSSIGYEAGSHLRGPAGWFGGQAGEVVGRHAGTAAGDKVDPARTAG